MDYSPPGSSVYEISQARILDWGAIFFSRGLPDPGIEPMSLALVGRFFTTEPPGKPDYIYICFINEVLTRIRLIPGETQVLTLCPISVFRDWFTFILETLYTGKWLFW